MRSKWFHPESRFLWFLSRFLWFLSRFLCCFCQGFCSFFVKVSVVFFQVSVVFVKVSVGFFVKVSVVFVQVSKVFVVFVKVSAFFSRFLWILSRFLWFLSWCAHYLLLDKLSNKIISFVEGRNLFKNSEYWSKPNYMIQNCTLLYSRFLWKSSSSSMLKGMFSEEMLKYNPFIGLKLTIKYQKKVWNMFKVNNENTRTTSLTSFWWFFFLTLNIFHTFF